MRSTYLQKFTIIGLVLLAISSNFASAGIPPGAIVNATLSVNCPFSIILYPTAPVFIQYGYITMNYSVKSLVQCSSIALTGNFAIRNSTTTALYNFTNLQFNSVSQIPINGVIAVNALTIPQSNDRATMALSYGSFSNSTTNTFIVLTPAIITISSLDVSPSTPSTGAQLQITANVVNSGALASSNMLLNLIITGPSFTYTTNEILTSLSPTQSEIIQFFLDSITPSPGLYTIAANVSYQTSFTQSNTVYTYNQISPTFYTSYVVTSPSPPPPHGGGGGLPPNITITPIPTSISSLVFEQMPIITTITPGNSSLAQVGLFNNGKLPLWVNITLPKTLFGTVNLSAKSVYVLPNATQYIEILFTVDKNATQNIYIVPFNTTVTAVGEKPSYGQFYTGLKVSTFQKGSPVYLRSSTLTTSTGKVSTQYSVYNPTNTTLYDTTLLAQLPTSITNNPLGIVLSGAVNNFTLLNNQYILNWKIPVLLPGATALLAFTVDNVTTPQYFFNPITSLSSLSQYNASRVHVFNIVAPTFYVNQGNNITVSAIYTGTNETNITFSLVPPVDIVVYNQQQIFRVFPNTVINAKFRVGPIKSSGTQLFNLLIKGTFSNQSFSIPVIVLQNQSVTIPSNTVTQVNMIQAYQLAAEVLIGAAAVLMIMAVGYVVYRRTNAPRYSKSRAEEMARMKQRVKREIADENKPGEREPAPPRE